MQDRPSRTKAAITGLGVLISATAGAVIGDLPRPWTISITVVAVGLVAWLTYAGPRSRGRLARVLIFLTNPLTAGLCAIGIVVLLGTATYAIGRRSSTPVDEPTARALRRSLPPSIRRACSDAREAERGHAIEVTCVDRQSDVSMTVTMFLRPGGATDEIKRRTQRLHLRPGRCFKSVDVAGSWTQADGRRQGALLCSGDAQLIWSVEDLNLVATATRPAGSQADLTAWWSRVGSKFETAPRDRPYPNEYERRVLSRLPERLLVRCERSSFTFDGALASVTCRPGGVEQMWVSLMSSEGALRTRFTGSKARFDLRGTSCGGPSGRPLISTRSGQRLCYTQADGQGGKEAWVEWTDDADLLYGYVRDRGSRLAALASWWSDRLG